MRARGKKDFMRSIAVIMCVLLLSAVSGFSQDCNVHFEVNAGPGIDVCGGGSVNLTGTIGGDASEAVWRGGTGKFVPSRNSLTVEYTPSEEEVGTGVVLILVASNPKFDCPPGRSEIKIIVNSQPEADAGPDQHVCAHESVQLKGVVKGKAKMLTWTSNGSGRFDNGHKADPVYTPSEKDITGGACSLEFTAIPYGVCEPSTDAMIVMFNPAPELETASDVYAVAKKPVNVSVKVINSADKIKWETEGTGKFENSENIQTNYISSGDDISKKTVLLRVIASKGSCTVTKQVTLHITPGKDAEKN